MRILFLGDIVGRPGRKAVAALLPNLIERHRPDWVIANGENAAGGFGITRKVYDELRALGIDCLTLGNHSWDQKEALSLVDETDRLIRPANYFPGTPGRGWLTLEEPGKPPLAIANLMGRAFMPTVDDPFRAADRFLAQIGDLPSLIDFHAETTAEKQALGFYLAGRCSAVVGTHTHVQTADERILEGKTAYITDVGMTGPWNSVIGMRAEGSVRRLTTNLPARFEVAEEGPVWLAGVIIDLDRSTASAIRRISVIWDETATHERA